MGGVFSSFFSALFSVLLSIVSSNHFPVQYLLSMKKSHWLLATPDVACGFHRRNTNTW